MKKIIYITTLLVATLFTSCESLDLELLDNPNEIPADLVDVNLVMNHLQLEINNLQESSNNACEGLVRHRHAFTNTWNGNASATGPWSTYYSDILPEASLVIEIAQDELSPLPFHEAIAKVFRAYGLMTLVDLYGDVPYSEAAQPVEFTDPKLDSGEELYQIAFDDLISAKAILDEGGSFDFNDFYYGGNRNKWITFINTLLFKYYLNLSSQPGVSPFVSEMNDLIAEGLIDSESEDFQFNYSSTLAPDSRHPNYVSEYAATAVGQYMSNYFMWTLNTEKVVKGITTNKDPRTRFYFFRQSLTIPGPNDIPTTQQVLPCLSASRPSHFNNIDPDLPFCIGDEVDVYWGRDVFNVDGIGPENNIRSTYGLYPIGGRFDDDRGQQIQNSLSGPRNKNGEGIGPIMLSSFVYFMRAEAAIKYNTSDDAASMTQSGIEASLDKVFNFRGINQNNVADERLAEYTTEVMAYYNSSSDKLEVIAKEALIATWGNAYEMYNMYRRTGHPLNFQPGIIPPPDQFPRSFFYPIFSVDGNASINQKSDTQTGPFWTDDSITLD